MQDTRLPSRKPAEEPEGGAVVPAERRRRRELLNEQLRAIYDSYAASEIPQRLLDLASQFEEQARHRLQGEKAGSAAGKTPPAKEPEDDDV